MNWLKIFGKRTRFGRIFPSKVRNLTVFSIIYMTRIRFFGPRELIQNEFRCAQDGCSRIWRGGREVEWLWSPRKRCHPSLTLQNSRGVLCANVAGKDVALAAGWTSGSGGRRSAAWAVPRGGTARTRRPAVVLFTDLACAFYSALPELGLGAKLSSRKRDDQVFGVGYPARGSKSTLLLALGAEFP